jgi:UDP-N-acetyl-D-glucosamine dehydrogenase
VRSIEIGARRMVGSPLSDALVRSQDAVVVTTDHSVFDMRRIVASARLVVDSRNACRGIRSPKIVKL